MPIALSEASNEIVGDGYLGVFPRSAQCPGIISHRPKAGLDGPFPNARGRAQRVADRSFRGRIFPRVATSTTRPEAVVNTDRQRKQSRDFLKIIG
jgi:hypothetical protein